jgi:hypothetical protein
MHVFRPIPCDKFSFHTYICVNYYDLTATSLE